MQLDLGWQEMLGLERAPYLVRVADVPVLLVRTLRFMLRPTSF